MKRNFRSQISRLWRGSPLAAVFRFYLLLLFFGSSFAWSQWNQQGFSYRHSDGSFSLQFPAGWAQSNPTSPVQAAYFLYNQGGVATAEAIVFIEPLVQAVTPQMYAQGAEQNSLRGLANYQKTAESSVSLGQQQAVWRQFNFSQNAQGMMQPITAEQYYMVVGSAAYTFHFATYHQFYTQMKPQFDQIIRSLQIVPVGPMPPQTLPMQQPASYPLIQSQPMQNPVSTYPQAQIQVPTMPQTTQQNVPWQNQPAIPSTVNESPTQGPPWAPHEAGEGPSDSAPKVSISPYSAPSSAWSVVPYQDPKGKFSIQVPSTWSTMETAAGMLSVSGTGYTLSVEIMPGPEAVEALQTVKLSGKEILSQGPHPIGNLNANQVVFKDEGLMGLKVISTLIVIKEKGILLTFTAPEKEHENVKKSWENILGSFQTK